MLAYMARLWPEIASASAHLSATLFVIDAARDRIIRMKDRFGDRHRTSRRRHASALGWFLRLIWSLDYLADDAGAI